jgi:hypothetical protein
MANTCVYVFTVAPDKDRAEDRVEGRLEDWREREFFEGIEVLRDSTVLVSSLSPEYFADGLERVDRMLRRRLEAAVALAECGNKSGEGYSLICAGNILRESLCRDMPWFNMDYMDWKVPDDAYKVPGTDWYAVMVDFRY